MSLEGQRGWSRKEEMDVRKDFGSANGSWRISLNWEGVFCQIGWVVEKS